MRYLRFKKDHVASYGLWTPEGVRPLSGAPFEPHQLLAGLYQEEDITLLAPVEPGQVFAIGLNYRKHIEEFQHIDQTRHVHEEPVAFMCARSAILDPEAPIILQNDQDPIHYEAELVVVIGKECFQVSEENALDYVFGYTCGNDISNRREQQVDKQWLRAKSHPSYKPLGPWIETDLDPSQLQVRSYVNGEEKQDGNTQDLIFPIASLVSYLSSFTRLSLGDVIFTGTPEGVGPLQNGDTVDIVIQGIGTLKNPVKLGQ